MDGKQQLRFAAAAFLAGCLWGYVRSRDRGNRTLLSLLQGVEWFIAYGGATALLEGLRAFVESPPPEHEPTSERVTQLRQIIAERTGTEG